MKDLLYIRGTRLYVHLDGPSSAPALLYLHGGPGTGSYDFEVFQQARLTRQIRLVTLDQRGVLRSDPLNSEDPFSLQDLIEDCEAVRHELGLSQWFVLGHSFGGYLATRYATTYPEAVQGLIFENPTFDIGLTARSLLQAAAGEFSALGDEINAERCLAFISQDHTPRKVWQAFIELGRALGPQRNALYVHGPEKDFFEQLAEQSPFPVEYWKRGEIHQQRLAEEGQMFHSVLSDLVHLKQPTLLIKGKYDAVTSDEELAHFQQEVKASQVLLYEESSHFVHVEEPQKYAEAICQFLLTRN
ncbi:MAG TPA: alpha/beta hydrolase [Ktedonobacteraceae bacterium]|nr:alpha/beta hydrolase [Ktedonobacteraceae bacterium]